MSVEVHLGTDRHTVFCDGRSSEGYWCQLEPDHTGPCSRVLWGHGGNNRRVYWWQDHAAGEYIGQLTKPEE